MKHPIECDSLRLSSISELPDIKDSRNTLTVTPLLWRAAQILRGLALVLSGIWVIPAAVAQTSVDVDCELATVNGQDGYIDFGSAGSLVVISIADEVTELATIDPDQHPQCKPYLDDSAGTGEIEASSAAATGAGGPRSVPATASAEEKQAAMLAAVNILRSTPTVCRGVTLPAVPPLTRAAGLDASAQAHSDDMAANNYFGHAGRDGSSFGSRAAAAGYTNFASGENIAAGSATVGDAIDNWLGSNSGHCEGLMTSKSSEMGSGGGHNPNAKWTNYWTFVSGRPR
jgi:uncharacterized protein YkwD